MDMDGSSLLEERLSISESASSRVQATLAFACPWTEVPNQVSAAACFDNRPVRPRHRYRTAPSTIIAYIFSRRPFGSNELACCRVEIVLSISAASAAMADWTPQKTSPQTHKMTGKERITMMDAYQTGHREGYRAAVRDVLGPAVNSAVSAAVSSQKLVNDLSAAVTRAAPAEAASAGRMDDVATVREITRACGERDTVHEIVHEISRGCGVKRSADQM